MKKYFILAVLLGSFLISKDEHIRQDAILFCLKPNVYPLEITRSNNIVSVNHPEINKQLSNVGAVDIHSWIRGTSDSDHDGDIYLNRIYRVILKSHTRVELDNQKSQFDLITDILSTEYEYIRKPFFTPNDSQYGQQWFLPEINSNDAWDLWDISAGDIPGNKSILLASVDTGVDWDHPDLRNNIWNNLGEDADGDGVTIVQVGNTWVFDPGDQNYIDDDGNGFIDDFIGWDCSSISGGSDNNPAPPSGVSSGGTWAHGTHVAGLLSATTNNSTGIASVGFNCSIMSVKVSTGEQSYPYITHGYEGILYAAKAGYNNNNITIINNSWGGIGYNQYEQAVIDIVHDDYGAIIVAAAGNGDDFGLGTDEFAHYPSSYNHVISVCAMGSGNNWNHWATYHESVDLASPGENIRSTRINNGYTSWTGSSMASPIAAGTIGLLRSYNMDWNNEMLETMILATADPIIYDVNPESYLQGKLGRGRVEALMAVSTPLFPQFELVGTDIFIPSNPGGDITPGENLEVMLILLNDEDWGTATNISTVLSSESNQFNIVNPNLNLEDTFPGMPVLNESNPFLVELSTTLETGEYEFQLTLTSNNNDYVQYQTEFTFSLFVVEGSQIMAGDVNMDSNVNILDIVITVNAALGQIELTSDQFQAADVNADGAINILDIVQIVNIILES
mgnify:CR=1 FL=1